jgi:hypothetical protein
MSIFARLPGSSIILTKCGETIIYASRFNSDARMHSLLPTFSTPKRERCPMNYLLKACYFIFGITLFGFAGLQLNDPDPIIWIGFYILCALIPSLLLFNIFNRPLFLLAIVWCGVELFISASGAYNYYLHMAEEPLMQSMNPQKPYIEECREFIGVLIALTLVVISAALARKKIFSTT